MTTTASPTLSTNVGNHLRRRARMSPDLEAIVDVAAGRRFTYTELHRRATQVADALHRLGLAWRPGCRPRRQRPPVHRDVLRRGAGRHGHRPAQLAAHRQRTGVHPARLRSQRTVLQRRLRHPGRRAARRPGRRTLAAWPLGAHRRRRARLDGRLRGANPRPSSRPAPTSTRKPSARSPPRATPWKTPPSGRPTPSCWLPPVKSASPARPRRRRCANSRSADQGPEGLADRGGRYRQLPMARSIWSGTISFG